MDDKRTFPRPTPFARKLMGSPRAVPRTAADAAELVFHEWGETQRLADSLQLFAAALDGTLATIERDGVHATDVVQYCQFLSEEISRLYSDARQIEHRLMDASRVFYHSRKAVTSA